MIVTSQAIGCIFGHDLEPMTEYFRFNDFAEAPRLIEDEPSINISRHLIAKSISALFPNSAKESWETEGPRAHVTTPNYPMPTIDLLDTKKTESYQLGPILESEGTIEGTATAKDNIYQKQMGWGKDQRLSLLRNWGCQIYSQHEIPSG